MSIGERISELRKNRGLSQGHLAQLLGVSRQAVSKWENDSSSPDTIRLIQLADILDTDAEYLATGNHSKVKSAPQVITMVQPVVKTVEVEKVVEKPVYIEKIVEIEKPIETIVERTRIKKVFRTRYIRNPLEFILVGAISFAVGILAGILL